MSTEKGSCQKEQGIIRGLREGVFVIQPNPTTTQYDACEKCGTQWTPSELPCPKCQDDTQPTPAPTPRTDAEAMKTPMKPSAESPSGWTSVVSSAFARALELELNAVRKQANDEFDAIITRNTELEKQLAAKDAEIENLVWNLAGCDTLAMGYAKPGEFSKELARPALHSVSKLRAERDALRAEVERLKAMTQTPAGWTERGEWKPECNSLYVYDAEGKLIGSNHPIAAVAEEYRLRYERIQLRAQLAAAQEDKERLIQVLREDIISANIIAAEVRQAGVNRHAIDRDIRFIIERCSAAIDAAKESGT